MEVVILGNGGAATSAVKTFVAHGLRGKLTLVSRDKTLPYSPVALPHFIEGKISRRQMYLSSKKFYAEQGIKTLWGRRVASVIARQKEVLLDDGSRLSYDKLLVATGASPRLPDIKGIKAKGVFTLSSLPQAEAIRKHLKSRAVVVGAGPIGIGLATTLKRMGIDVSLVEILPQVLGRLADFDTSQAVVDLLSRHGVKVYLNQQVTEIYGNPVAGVKLGKLDIKADTVVIAIGVKPNTEFINRSEIKLGDSGGIVTDERMRSSHKDVYAAGDCAETEEILTGRKIVNAIWPNAIEQGKVAALNIMGRDAQFAGSLVMNTLSIFDVPLATIGNIEGEKVTHTARGSRQKFTIQQGRVVGAQMIAGIDSGGRIAAMIRAGLLQEQDIPSGYASFLATALPRQEGGCG